MKTEKKHPDQKGKVITFYSYKGGVGRSFILANVATQLALWGYRVLCLDWDLEAPGLIEYFRDEINDKRSLDKPGVIDLLLSYQNPSTNLAQTWQDAVISVNVTHRADSGICGSVDIIHAGQDAPGAEYIERVRELDWDVLYTQHEFARQLDSIKREWQGSYDFILIDSRTGISDISGVCTVQLPDILALVLTPARQSLDGILQVATRAVTNHSKFPLSEGKLLTVPIVSRLDQRDETAIAEHWLGRIAKSLEPLYGSWLHRDVPISRILDFSKVPYISRWSFGESLPILLERGSDTEQISYSLKSISGLLTAGIKDSANYVERRDFVLTDLGDRLAKASPVFSSPLAQQIYESNSAGMMASYAVELHETGENLDDAEILYERAIELDPLKPSPLGNFALFLENYRKDYDRAEELYERSLKEDPKHANRLSNFAVFLESRRQNYDRAEELYEKALKEDPHHAGLLGNFAVFLKVHRQDYDRAEELYEKALKEDSKHPNNLGNFAAFLTSLRHDDTRAEELYERALKEDPTHSNHLGNFAGFLFSQGRREEGLKYLERSKNLCEDDDLLVELKLYEFGFSPPLTRSTALHNLLDTLDTGKRTEWDFSRQIAQIVREEPEREELMTTLAAVANGEKPLSSLGSFPEVIEAREKT